MGIFANLGILGASVAVAGAFGFVGGWKIESDRMAAQALKQAEHVTQVVQAQGQVNTEVAAQAQAHQDTIKYVTKTIHDQVPVYVTQKADADCSVPVGFVRVLDAAAASVPATGDPSGRPNDAPSGLAISAVADSVAANYGLANAARQQLIDLQGWIRRQNEATTSNH